MAAEDSTPLYPTGGALAYRAGAGNDEPAPLRSVTSPASVGRKIRRLKSADAPPPDRTLHVAPGRGFSRTLKRAFELHAAGKSVRVVFASGIYRKSFSAPPSSSTSRLLLEAREPGTAVFRGSDVWSGWKEEGNLWRAPWPHRWGLGAAPDTYGDPHLATPDLMRRREIVFVDGRRQRQVLERRDLEPGSFLVDEGTGGIFLHPESSVLPSKVPVEVGVRSGLLQVSGRRNVTLRGLRFEHDASFFFTPQRAAAEFHDCSNLALEDCDFCENNVKGLQITGTATSDIALRHVTANRNGCLGILAARVRNLHLEDCDTSFNNWRGAWAGKYRGSPAGIKIMRARGATLLRHRAVRNLATGIWIDEDNRDVRITRGTVHGNYRGIHVEAGIGPTMIEETTVSGNRQEPVGSGFRWAFGSGVAITHAADVTLRGNFLADNDVAQVGVRDDRESRVLHDPLTNEKSFLRTERLTLEDNLIVATGPAQSLLQMPGEDFDRRVPLDSLRAEGNAYVGVIGRPGFGLGSFSADGPQRHLPFAEWRSISGQDTTSSHESA